MPKTSVLITKIKNAGKRVTEAVARIKQTFKNLDYTKNDDVNILQIDIRSLSGGGAISVIPQFVEMQIHEDMFSDFVYGSLTLLDNQNLMSVVPIVVNEEVIIEFATPKTRTTKKFIGEIYSIDSFNPSKNERSELFTLRFVSKNYFPTATRKVSGSYSGNMKTIVRKIKSQFFPSDVNFQIDLPGSGGTAKEKKNYIIPYLNPIKTMNWLAVRAIPSTNPNEVNYRFYEDSDGYHFVNICDFMDKPVKKTVFLSKTNQNIRKLDEFLSTVYSYQFSDVPDKVMNSHTGLFNSSMSIYDINTKKFKYVTQDYHSFFENTKHLNKGRVIPKTSEDYTESTMNTRNFVVFDSQKRYATETNKKPDTEVEDTLLKRNSLLQQFGQFKVNLLMPGDTRAKIGDIYEIKSLKRGEIKDGDPKYIDEIRSGKYLVTAIKHTLNNSGYRVTVEASRDSYSKELADGVFPESVNKVFSKLKGLL